MTYQVLIRRISDGVERWATVDADWNEAGDYLWTDGNYGCDCNRHIFFEHAGGVPHDEIEDVDCGETLYRALRARLPSGRTVLIDESAAA